MNEIAYEYSAHANAGLYTDFENWKQNKYCRSSNDVIFL